MRVHLLRLTVPVALTFLAISEAVPADSRPTIRQVWAGNTVPVQWAVSPSGRVIAYGDSKDEISTFDVLTRERRSLRPGPRARGGLAAIAWSQDGKEIAYAWRKADGVEVRIIRATGGQPRVIPAGEYCEPLGWSADHKHLIVEIPRQATSDFASMDLSNGELQLLKSISNPARLARPVSAVLSPDGRHLAVGRVANDGNRDVFLISTADGRETALIKHNADDFPLAWTSDGTRLLFSSDRTGTVDAWIVNVKEGVPSGLPERVRRDLGVVRPHGMTREGALFYEVTLSTADVYQADLDPSTSQLTGLPTPVLQRFTGYNSGPDWSPDSRELIAQIGFAGVPNGVDLLIHSWENGNERLLRPMLSQFNHPSYSADGLSVVVHGRGVDGVQGIHSVDLQSGASRLLVNSEEAFLVNPTWADNGRSMFYERGGNSIWLLDRDGRTKQVYKAESASRNFASSPSLDGQTVAVVNGASLYVVSVPSGEAKEILHLTQPDRLQGYPGSLAWTADRRWIMFGRNRGDESELLRISSAGGALEPLGVTARDKDIYFLRASVDGRHLAFVMGDVLTRGPEIWAMENFLTPR